MFKKLNLVLNKNSFLIWLIAGLNLFYILIFKTMSVGNDRYRYII